jgi:hypothetical protein
LFRLPLWAQIVIAVATVVLVGGLALLVDGANTGPLIPWSAIVAAVIAFGYVAWHTQRR